jgi:hypothetical protein
MIAPAFNDSAAFGTIGGAVSIPVIVNNMIDVA